MYTEASKLSTRLQIGTTNKTILWAFKAIKISNSVAHTRLMSQHVTEDRDAAKVRAICLTFKNRASYVQDERTATLQMLHFIYFFSTKISTEYFKHAAHSPFFSSKCHLFRNVTFWFLYYSHFTYKVC
jgi:hypothetical protein